MRTPYFQNAINNILKQRSMASPTGPTVAATPAPPIALGTDANVNAAYRRMQEYGIQSEADTGQLRRNLATNFDTSQKNRLQSVLNNNQRFADNGILDSGITLNKNSQTNTQFDTADTAMQGAFDKSLGDIGRNTLGYQNAYGDAQVVASHDAMKAQADAAALAITQQHQAEQAAKDQASLLAALQAQVPAQQQDYTPQAQVTQNAPAATINGMSYADAARAYMNATAKPKAVPVVKSPIPRLVIRGRS